MLHYSLILILTNEKVDFCCCCELTTTQNKKNIKMFWESAVHDWPKPAKVPTQKHAQKNNNYHLIFVIDKIPENIKT